MNVVIDTNVFISGMFWKGNEERVLDLCINGDLTNHSSLQIVEEIDRVLHYRKFHLEEDEIEKLIHIFLSFSNVIIPLESVNVIEKDPSDDKFIECALSSNAEYLITGDRDLLVLKRFDNIRIINANEFLMWKGSQHRRPFLLAVFGS